MDGFATTPSLEAHCQALEASLLAQGRPPPLFPDAIAREPLELEQWGL
jgi:hypothetical protein